MDSELNARYPNSAKNNFEVWDYVESPHKYTVSPEHYLQENRTGNLLSVEMAELNGVTCGFIGDKGRCTKMYADHTRRLLIMCHKNYKTSANVPIRELRKYMEKIEAQSKQEGYTGFVFLEDKSGANKLER